jgi:DNA polymerase
MDTYTAKLEAAGYPEDCLMIDFECYFDVDYSITKMSTIEFITDERFEFTGVGWGDSPNWYACFQHDVPKAIKGLQVRYGDQLERITVVFKNAKFDATILQEKFNIVPPYIVDIDDIARHYDSRMSHSLKDLAIMFKLEAKGDTMQFKGGHLIDMAQDKKDALELYCKGDIRIQARVYEILMDYLTWPEMEIPIARHTLGLYLNPRLSFDFDLANEVLGKMQDLLNEITEPTGLTAKVLGSRDGFCDALQELLPKGELVPYKQGKNGLTPAFAKGDVEFQQLLSHVDPKVSRLCNARQAVKSWPLHISRIKKMTAQAWASYGSLRVPLHYYGCHTGRPSGGEKINLLNLGGKGRTGQGTHKLIAMIRKMLLAPEGQSLVINDSAQIECRLLAWLVGQSDLMIGFANKEDIYSVFATELFGEFVRKSKDSDLPEEKRLFDLRRGFGKDAILGCGYGMGPTRFHENCLSNPDLRPMFDDGTYTYAFIERLIRTYRNTYSKVPDFWRQIEKLFKFVTTFPKEIVYYKRGTTGMFDAEGALLTLWNNGGTVCIKLPSGRVLYYRHCSVTRDKTINWQWGHLWGGSLTENIIQSIARDLLMLWIVECEAENIPVVTHCYDEIVGLVNDAEAEECLDIMDQIMCEPPEWALDLPLASEGMISKFYTK